MPTPGGLPKPGETWRRTQTLPKHGTNEWETTTVDVTIIERSRGDYWSVRVRLPDGQVKLWVDVSYDWSRGNFTYVDPEEHEQFDVEAVVAEAERLGAEVTDEEHVALMHRFADVFRRRARVQTDPEVAAVLQRLAVIADEVAEERAT